MKEIAINCQKCKYFFVTWDYTFPKGCRLFGIKSKEQPSQMIYKSTGKKCINFENK